MKIPRGQNENRINKMKLDLKTILIAGLTVVVIIFIMRDCSRPSEEMETARKEQYETQIAILEAEKTSIQTAQDSIKKFSVQRSRKDSVALALQESKIQALEKKAVGQRVVVDTLILNNPDLLAFVTTQQEVIQELKIEIDTLKAQKEFQRKLNEDLIALEFIEDKIEVDMAVQSSRRISDLEKSTNKARKGSRLLKAGAVLTTIGAFLFGTAL